MVRSMCAAEVTTAQASVGTVPVQPQCVSALSQVSVDGSRRPAGAGPRPAKREVRAPRPPRQRATVGMRGTVRRRTPASLRVALRESAPWINDRHAAMLRLAVASVCGCLGTGHQHDAVEARREVRLREALLQRFQQVLRGRQHAQQQQLAPPAMLSQRPSSATPIGSSNAPRIVTITISWDGLRLDPRT